MAVLGIYSNKGGVGKTATSVNLAYLAAQAGARTLLCDLDPQGSSTYYFRVKASLKSGAKGLIKGGSQVFGNIKGTDYENLDLLPADFSLRNLDVSFNKLGSPKKRLKKILNLFKDKYDLVLLDCPVTISLLAENILLAVDHLLIPMIPTTLSVRTLKQLLYFCKKKGYNTDNIYAFFSMVDLHKKMHKELMIAVSEGFNNILGSFIPYLAQIEKMGIYRAPVVYFSPGSPASKAYRNLWDKVQKIVFSHDRNY
ncbi:MAG: ParA family protein [Deltaproteobacteria bacterium]|nr:ParA family protein [Deltaproteobacteria bacterium]